MKSYLLNQPVGTTNLTFDFSSGTDSVLAISITDATPDVTKNDASDLSTGDSSSVPVDEQAAVTGTNSNINLTDCDFDMNSTKQADIPITLTLNGNTLSGIYNDTDELTSGTDYTVSGNEVTILKSYLLNQPEGTTKLTFDFSSGTDPVLAISITDSTPDVRKITGLVVLVDFSDQEQQVTTQEITNMLNQKGYSNYENNGSVKDYWLDVSGGKAKYSNIVIGYYRAQKPKSDYEKSGGSADLMNEALAYAKSTGFDFSTLSQNGDNQIESFSVMYAGDATSELNPQSSSISSDINGEQTVLKGHIVQIGSEPSLGTFCHESGHTLFAMMDTYAGGYTQLGTTNTSGLGNYDLMSNAGSDKNPVPPNPYFRYKNGWLNIVPLNDAGDKSLNDLTANSNTAFVCYKNPDAPNLDSSEYYLIEKVNTTDRRTAMPGEGILVWHIDFTGLNNGKEEWVPISIVQADGKNDLENNSNAGDQSDFFTTQTLSDTTTPNVKWWDDSTSGLLINCSNNSIVCNSEPYDYSATTPYGVAEIKFEPYFSSAPPELWVFGYNTNEPSPYLQYGEIKARVFSYLSNGNSLAVVIYNKDNEIIKTLQYDGNRYAKEMHLDAVNQTLVISGQAFSPTIIPLTQLAPYVFPPEIKVESRSSISELIPPALEIGYDGVDQIPYLEYGEIKARVFSYVDNRQSLAVAFYNKDNEIIKIIEYTENKDAKEMQLNAVNQTLVITGQAESPTIVPLTQIESIAFPTTSETDTGEPQIKFESRSSALVAPGTAIDYQGYEQIPYLEFGEIKARVFSYIDNGQSLAVAIYNKDNEIVKTLEYPGNSDVKEIHLDEVNQTLVITGQADAPTIVPLTQISIYAFPAVIKFQAKSSVITPTDLHSGFLWKTSKFPYLQYGVITVKVFSYASNGNSLAVVIYNKYNEIIKIVEYPGNRYPTDMQVDEVNQTLVITGQSPTPTIIPLSEIAAYQP